MSITGMNHAVLYVRDARKSSAFYESVLGFVPVIDDAEGRFQFMRAPASDNHHDIAFFSLGDEARSSPPGTVGLYHVAWQVPSMEDLDAVRRRLESVGALAGTSDHGTNKSLYAKDPDGLEFEVMYLTPPETWGDEASEAIVRPLDMDAELRRWAVDATAEPPRPTSDGSVWTMAESFEDTDRPGFRRRVMDGDDLQLWFWRIRGGSTGSVLHRHGDHEQLGIVIRGELDFRIGQPDSTERRVLQPGDVYHAPRNVWHGDSVFIGDDELDECWILDVFTPPRKDL